MTFPFLFGVMLFRFHRAGRLDKMGLPVWLLSIVLIAALCVPLLPSPWNAVYDCGVVLLVFPAIVAAGSAHEPRGRWIPLVGLSATLSYPLYILHWPLMELLEKVPALLAMPGLARFAMLLAVILPISWVAAYWYDEPLRRHLRRRFAPFLTGRSGGVADRS